jgi:hypothetical protein
MALVVKKRKDQSQQQLINEFRRLTYLDEGIEKIKQTVMMGYVPPSKHRHMRKREIGKILARIRRRNKRKRA